MSVNHNRIKVADLEKNLPNKILMTNSDGELEFIAFSSNAFLWRIGLPETNHFHIVSLTVENARKLVENEASQVFVQSNIVNEHTHEITIEFDPEKNLFVVTDISNNDEDNHVIFPITNIEQSDYTHPLYHPASIIVQDQDNRFVSDTEKEVWNDKQSLLNGTGIVKSNDGVISYLTDNSNNWNTAYEWGNYRLYGLGIANGSSVLVSPSQGTSINNGIYGADTTATGNPLAASGSFLHLNSAASGFWSQFWVTGNSLMDVRAFISSGQGTTRSGAWREIAFTNNTSLNGTTNISALNLSGTADTFTISSHYFTETGSDGFIRPKTLANVRTEIVTNASINTAKPNILTGSLVVNSIPKSNGSGGLVASRIIDDGMSIKFNGYTTTSEDWTFNIGGGFAMTGTLYDYNYSVISNPYKFLVKSGSQILGISPSFDGTFADNSDILIPSQKAVKTYVDTVSSPISGSNNYIQNQIVTPQNSGFNISGKGIFGDKVLIGTGIVDDGVSKLQVNGSISALGGTSTDWNLAFSWGNHATQNYFKNNYIKASPISVVSGYDANNTTGAVSGGMVSSRSTGGWLTNGATGFTFGSLLTFAGANFGTNVFNGLQIQTDDNNGLLAARIYVSSNGTPTFKPWRNLAYIEGTTNNIQKVTSAGVLGNSNLSDNGTIVTSAVNLSVNGITVGVNNSAPSFGSNAGQNNTGTDIGLFSGTSSGRYNTGTGLGIVAGFNAGGYNTGNYIGIISGYNTGTFQIGNFIGGIIGTNAGQYNTGGNIGGIIGQEAGQYNTANNFGVLIGTQAGRYNANANNVIGHLSHSVFAENVAGVKTFNFSDIDVTTKYITITAHSFGAINAYVNLKYNNVGGTAIGGIVNNAIIQARIIDANTVFVRTPTITSQGTGTHSFTPQFNYTNVNIFGNNVNPTQNNQTIIGNSSTTNTRIYGLIDLSSTADTSTASTHYFTEVASDGNIRPKTLANVQAEIVTNASINLAKPNIITGSGTVGYLPIFGTTSSLMNGSIWEENFRVSIGTGTSPLVHRLTVNQSVSGQGILVTNNIGGYANLDLESSRTSGNLGGVRIKKLGDSFSRIEINGTSDSTIDFNVGDGTAQPVSRVVINQFGLRLIYSPATSTTGLYDFVTRSTANGNIEKLTLSGAQSAIVTNASINSAKPNIITGTGTIGYLPRFNLTNDLISSSIFEDTTILQARIGSVGFNLGDISSKKFSIRSSTPNESALEVFDVRTSAGNSWTTSGTRIQSRIDTTSMSYIQFNGTGNNSGISIGTGGSSVSPLSVIERFRISNSGDSNFFGRLSVGSVPTFIGMFEVHSESSDTIVASHYSDSTAQGGSFFGRKSGGTRITPTSVLALSVLTGLYGAGYDGVSSSQYSGAIRILSEGVFTTTSKPTFIDFSTTSLGSIQRIERMRLTSDGNLMINKTVNDGNKLQVSGSAKVDGLVYTRGVVFSGDLNNLTDAGFYTSNNPTNSPISGAVYITIERQNSNSNSLHQTVTSYTTNEIFSRVRLELVWTPWKRLAYSEEFTGIAKTYTELQTLVNSNQLIPNAKYKLTDYMTTYTQPVTNATKSSGIIEPLYLTAVSNNSFDVIAKSELYPQDIIYYSFSGDIGNGLGTEGFTKGKIYRRIDQLRNNDIGTDWRHVKYDRSGVDKLLFESYIGCKNNKLETYELFDNVIGFNFQNNISTSVFIGNTIGNVCINNKFEGYFINNTIGNNFGDNSMRKDFQNNIIGNEFNTNTIEDVFENNTIGKFTFNKINARFTNNNVSGTDISFNVVSASFLASLNVGIGMEFFVSDALSPAWNQEVVGGGSVSCRVYRANTMWVCS